MNLVIHIGEIFIKYKEQLARRSQNEPILNLREDSDFGELFRYFPLNTQQQYIYWMILLFKKLELVEPPRPGVDHKSLCSKFKICIDKIFEHDNIDEKSTLLDYIDEILSNELRSCSEISAFLNWINISKEVTKSALCKDMMYKKTAFLYSAGWILKSFKNLNELENVPKTLDYLYSIYNSNIIIKELNNLIADYVIEYIETKYLNNSNYHNSSEFNNSFKLIDKLSLITESLETKEAIKRLYDRCIQIQAPFFSENVEISDQPVQNYDLIPSRVTKDQPPIDFRIATGNITVSFYNAKLDSSRDVFVKTYTATSNNYKDLKIFENEISILERLSEMSKPDNCFLEFIGTYTEGSSINLVMPRMDQNLKTFIQKNKKLSPTEPSINENLFLNIARKLVQSFKSMIDKGISHQDIKPDNILIDDSEDDPIIKIIDFNISLIRGEDVTIQNINDTKVKGTKLYLCPQKLKAWNSFGGSVDIYPEKSDVYSLGLVFVQLLTSMDISDRLLIPNRLDQLLFVEDRTKDFIREMLKENPKERVSFGGLLEMINFNLATAISTRLTNQ